MRKAILLAIVVFLASTASMVFAQDETDIHGTVRIDYRHAMPGLSFSRGYDMDADFNLEPENSDYLGIQYSTRGFSIGLSTDAMFGNESGLREIFLSWFGQRLGFELFHQNYRNYYIARDDTEGKKYPGTPNEYPDLRVLNTGLSGYWFFRDNNYRGINGQSEDLLVDSWSPLVKVTAGRFALHNDGPIIPESLRDNYDEHVRTMNRGDFYQLSVSFGITGTYTWRRLYVAGMVTAGGTVINQRWETIEGNSYSSYALDIDTDLQAVIGYMEGDYFFGFWFINENQWASVENLSIQLMNFQVSYFAGMRI